MNKKVKKFISKGLIASILFANISVNSLASTLSEDTRYETFEGNNIAITNILEEDAVDIELEGNTLVNLTYGNFEKHGSAPATNVSLTENTMSATTSSEGSLVGIKKATLKSNTVYTVICDLNTNLSNIRYSFKNATNYVQGSTDFDCTNYTQGYTKVIKKITTTSDCTHVVIGSHSIESAGKYLNIKNLILLEGDWTNKEIPEYFAGIKSVGQDDINGHGIEVLSNNKNLVPIDELKKYIGNSMSGSGILFTIVDEKIIINGTATGTCDFRPIAIHWTPKMFKFINSLPVGTSIRLSNNLGLNNYWAVTRNGQITYLGNTITIQDGDVGINCFVRINKDNSYTNQELQLQIEINKFPTEYIAPKFNKKEIILNEPLRGFSNGVKDRIVKRNGQWYVERNCKEVISTGNESWNIPGQHEDVVIAYTKDIKGMTVDSNLDATPCLSDRLPPSSVDIHHMKSNMEGVYTAFDGNLCVSIAKSKLSSPDVQGVKEWLSQNPTKIVYQLEKPVYERINIDSLPLYLETTYVSNNSLIPLKMKLIVDRVVNRAKEFIEIAKLNPTSENLSQARYWINLMQDSILKDELQNEVSSINNIIDLEIDKKILSVNTDIYIKMTNTLSMSLDTNSISFKGYTGSEDLEILKALNITVDSSLPYNLNVYMPTGIYNSDKTKNMDINVLNIKESTEETYKQFVSTNSKLVLKENCEEGEDKTHTIDLKLSGNTHKADIYKTVLKFEAEQK